MARAAVAGVVGAAALGMAPTALGASVATLMIKPPNPDFIKSSTYSAGSFTLSNQSTGGVDIDSFTIDLRDGPALFWDFAFDPDDGTPAGDTVGKRFTQDAGTSSGLTSSATYAVAEGRGWAVMNVDTQNFDPGDQLKFSIDVDPTSTQDTPGTPSPHQASVSGAELHGATVTVRFSDGSTQINDIVRVSGNDKDGSATLKDGLPPAPTLSRLGLAVSPAKVKSAQQSVVVTGPAGAQGVVLVAEGHLVVTGAPGGGFDLDPFEANMAVKFTEVPFTIGQNGAAVVPVTLTTSPPPIDTDADPPAPYQPRDSGLNYITAYLVNEVGAGQVSPPIVLQHDPNLVEDTDPPEVATVSPADKATGVATGTNVTVAFDEAMSPATVGAAFTLADEAGAPVAAAVSGSGTTYTLDPTTALAPGKRYTATVAATAADAAGNPLGTARTWSFTTGQSVCSGDHCNPPPPPPNPRDPWCAVVPERPKSGGKGNAKIELEASQLLISQRIAQAAVRRANAIQEWLAEGIVTDDLCGNALGQADFGAGVSIAAGPSTTPITPADPRPIVVRPGKSGGRAARVALDAGQLLINQRISQAAVRRVNALAARLKAGLTGGDIRDGAISGAKIKRDLVIAAAPGGPATPASVTPLGNRGGGGGGGKVTVSVEQLQINQRISQAAVRRVNELVDRLMRGLTGDDFRDGTVGAADLAPGLRPSA